LLANYIANNPTIYRNLLFLTVSFIRQQLNSTNTMAQ